MGPSEWILRLRRRISLDSGGDPEGFVMRFRRSSSRRRYREGVALEMVPEPQSDVDGSTLEANEVLDTLAALLPTKERNLLILVRKGHSLARAAELLGIPPEGVTRTTAEDSFG